MQKQKKKIALMTWYTYHNYGTALQASALYYKVEQLGYTPMLVQYYPKGGRKDTAKITVNLLLKKLISKISKRKILLYSSEEREKLFDDYLKLRITETEVKRTYSELFELNQEFDAFVCGSDQIWSPLCFDDKYFLSYVDNSAKMVAYAPSIGSIDILDLRIKDEMAKYISRFEHLSVREQQGADLIGRITNLKAEVVLDPTLLLKGEEWDKYAKVHAARSLGNKSYIICYFLGEAERYMDYVKQVSEKLQLPFYVIPVSKKQKNSMSAVPFEVGPEEFVALIRNSAYVCTDSFHGMAFSINYKIPFSVFKRFKENDPKNQNSRIYNLLNALELEDRLVEVNEKISLKGLEECDFSKANYSLDTMRISSEKYLSSALEQAVKANEKCKTPYEITKLCCGCGTCAAVCSKKAISVMKDSEGFEHYCIDEKKCVRCGRCKDVCPMYKVEAAEIRESKALYAMKSSSPTILQTSSSGGVGYEIARFSQQRGMFVGGCIYDSEENCARHINIAPDEVDKLGWLQGSKYIQSISAPAICEIGEIVKTNELVFFGTPCQIAGVDKLLRKYNLRENALLIDLICHGVPSFLLWDKYLKGICRKYKLTKDFNVEFRNKQYGWRNRKITIGNGKNYYKKNEIKDDFYAFFRRGLCNMKACFDCPYREKSAADIRIGDFWGEKYQGDKNGVSMVITNSTVGEKLLKEMLHQGVLEAVEHDLKEYWTVQYPYNHLIPTVRRDVLQELKDESVPLHRLRKKYCSYYDWMEFISKIKQGIKKMLK